MADTTQTPTDDETVNALDAARALLGEEAIEEEIETQETPDIPGIEPMPQMPTTLDPEPPKRKQRKKPGKVKNPFQNLVGAGERLLVHKRDPINGQLAYIGQYAPEDLMRAGSVEVFLREYVVPTFDFGEFQLTLLGTDGNQKPMGSVKVAGPAKEKGAESSIKELFDMQAAMDKKAKEESDANMKNMIGMMGVMKSFMPAPKEGGSDPMSAMMPMLMMMMMQQKPSGPDPMMQMLMMKMFDKGDEAPPAPLPMMPPLPQQSSESNIAEVAALIQALRPAQNSTPVQDLAAIAQMFQKDDSDKLTIKDLISLAPTFKDILGGGNKSSFKETIENLGMLQTIAGGMGQQEEGGFWDFAQDLVQNMPALASVINARKDGKPLPAEATQPQPTAKQRKKQRKVPPLVPGFEEYTKTMMEAAADEDEGVVIENCLRGVLFLREKSPQWKPYVESFMTLASKDEKDKAMKFLEVFLQTFLDKNLIDADCANFTFQSFDDNWDDVLVGLGFKEAEKLEAPKEADKQESSDDAGDEGGMNGHSEGGVSVIESETVAEADSDDVIEEDDEEEIPIEELTDEQRAQLEAEQAEDSDEEEESDEKSEDDD
jgi:hypothetical protein